MKIDVKKITILGLLLSLAVILGYVEAIFPLSVGIPGVKLGLCNIMTIIILYVFGNYEALYVGVLRVIIVGFLFANLSMVIYSLCGFLTSYVIMLCLKKFGIFSVPGVSIAGAVTHNMAQLFVATIITGLIEPLLYYGIVLVIAGLICGLLTGLLSKVLIPAVKNIYKTNSV